MKNVLFILGTRPEAIKLAPVILKCQESDKCNVIVCNTEQQKELSNQTLSFFNIKPDHCLNVMSKGQTLEKTQAKTLNRLSTIYKDQNIHSTIIQGDTITAFSGALVSFYNKTPLFHVEAGLRSSNILEPFPEEAPAFGVPLLVMRLTTERKESVNSGFAQLVGHTKDVIISKASEVLAHEKVHTRIKNVNNPYGDGKSAIRIKNFIEHYV
jgi:UDP-N-acetylglucosamine 2-epimerase (non-hydrolysing)